MDDPHLFCHLVRDGALEILKGPGVAFDGFRVDRLNLGGIMLSGHGLMLRILKAERMVHADGSVERLVRGPGHSALRREYYEQPALSLDPAKPLLREAKFVVIWDIGPNYGLTSIDLACPRVWDQQASRVDNHWMVPWGRVGQGEVGSDQGDHRLLPDFDQIRERQPDPRQAAGDASPG